MLNSIEEMVNKGVPAEFSEQIEGFRRSFLVRVLGLLAVTVWIAGMVVLFFRTSTVAVAALFGFEAVCWLSFRLCRAGRLRTAQHVLAIGLDVYVIGILWLVPDPPLLFLPVLATVVGVAVLDTLPAAVYGLLLFAAQLASAIALFPGTWLQWQILLPCFLTVVTTALAMVWGANLYTILGWAVHSTRAAIDRLEQVQEHRAQLRHSMEELDAAFHRLERANEMLTVARAEAEEARHARNQFALTVSHELRTPLHFIIGFSELMVNAPETYADPQHWPPGLYDDIREVYHNSTHLMRLVNDILELGQAEARQMVLTKEWVNPAQIVQETQDIMRAAINARSLYFVTDMDPDLPDLFVDRTRIRQVLINLIGNSLRFTENGGITVSVRKRATQVLFSVEDTGVGIPSDEISRVFQEFGQADATVWRRRGGSGLGVPISRRFVEMHGGEMWLESTVGRGTDFHFTLPLPGAAGKPLVDGPGDLPQGAPRNRSNKGESRKIVLVLSPDPNAAQLLEGSLDGYEIAAAMDAVTTGRLVSDLLPHALLVDQAIAADTDVTAMVRSLPYDLPVIVVNLPGSTAQSRQLPPGVFRHLVKPVPRQALAEAIRNLPVSVRCLLVVDDDPGMARFVSLAMAAAEGRSASATEAPVQVYPALTGRDAMDLLGKTCPVGGNGGHGMAPDAVLLDLNLPDISGWDVLEAMQRNEDWAKIPVILVTAAELPQEIDSRDRQVLQVSTTRPLTSERPGQALTALLRSLRPSFPAGAGGPTPPEGPSA